LRCRRTGGGGSWAPTTRGSGTGSLVWAPGGDRAGLPRGAGTPRRGGWRGRRWRRWGLEGGCRLSWWSGRRCTGPAFRSETGRAGSERGGALGLEAQSRGGGKTFDRGRPKGSPTSGERRAGRWGALTADGFGGGRVAWGLGGFRGGGG